MDDGWKECLNRAGFVQRIVILCQKGYPYYITGQIRPSKDPHTTDTKLLGKYAPELNRRRRAYRKSLGLENGHYVRHGWTWVLLMTHPSFVLDVDDKEQVWDLRQTPLQVLDYSIGLRPDGAAKRHGIQKLRASVRFAKAYYLAEKAYFVERAVHWSVKRLGQEMWEMSSLHVKYKPIYRQWQAILDAVNQKRRAAGLHERVTYNHIRWYAPAPKHFGTAETARCEREDADTAA